MQETKVFDPELILVKSNLAPTSSCELFNLISLTAKSNRTKISNNLLRTGNSTPRVKQMVHFRVMSWPPKLYVASKLFGSSSTMLNQNKTKPFSREAAEVYKVQRHKAWSNPITFDPIGLTENIQYKHHHPQNITLVFDPHTHKRPKKVKLFCFTIQLTLLSSVHLTTKLFRI